MSFLGTEEERGLSKWRQHMRGEPQQQQVRDNDEASSEAVDTLRSPSPNCYDLPCCMYFVRRSTLLKFVPFCPTFLVNVKHTCLTNDQQTQSTAL